MTDTTPLKGIPSRHIGGFASPLSRAGSTPTSVGGLGSSPSAGPNRPSPRTLAGRKDGGIKLLDITEQPIGFAQAKKRKRQQGNAFPSPTSPLQLEFNLNFRTFRIGSCCKGGHRVSDDSGKSGTTFVGRGIGIGQRLGNSRETRTHSRLRCRPRAYQSTSHAGRPRHPISFHFYPYSYTVEGTTSSGSCPSSCGAGNQLFTSSFTSRSYPSGSARHGPTDGCHTWRYYCTYRLPISSTCRVCRTTCHGDDSYRQSTGSSTEKERRSYAHCKYFGTRQFLFLFN